MRKDAMLVVVLVSVVLVLIACNSQQNNESSQPASKQAIVRTRPATAFAPTATLDPMEPPQLPTAQATSERSDTALEVTYVPPTATNTPKPEEKIAPDLASAMKNNPQHLEFFVVLQEQATYPLNTTGMSASEYGNTRMQEVAARTQPAVKADIVLLQQSGQVTSFESFTIFNGFYIEGTAQAVLAMSQRSDVAKLELNNKYKMVDSTPSGMFAIPTVQPTPTSVSASSLQIMSSKPESVDAVPTAPWNLNLVGALTPWALSTPYRGQGVTVGIVDSGVDYTHPLLSSKYRGASTGSNDFNWKDVGGSSNFNPHDGFGHGTAVTSVVLGSFGDFYSGVAPDANWIACKVADDVGNASDLNVNLCLQWMAAPTNSLGIPDPTKAPRIVNLSIRITGSDQAFWNVAINNLMSSSIVPVLAMDEFQLGGPTPTPYFPITGPSKYRSSFSVGAVAYGTPGGTPIVAFYSARGPAPTSTPSTNLVKPDLVAPGGSGGSIPEQNILVAIPTNIAGAYGIAGYKAGTSFAAPHVGGAAAILFSRNPLMTAGQAMYWLDHGTLEGTGHQPSAPETGRGFGLLRIDKALSLYNGFANFTCPSPTFTDISNSPFSGPINFLACAGVVSGYGDGTFQPSAYVSRAQFAKFISIGLGVAYYNPSASTFADVNVNNFLRPYIESAARAGIILGEPCSTSDAGVCFRPNDSIRRGEAAIMIQRGRQYSSSVSCSFDDVPCGPPYGQGTPHYAWSAIEALKARGAISGEYCSTGGSSSNGTCFRPNDFIKRGEMSKIMSSAVVRVGPYGNP